MKIRLLTAALLAVFGLATMSAVRLDPESHAYLSDPKYQKYIDVQCYLVTREQLAEVIVNPQIQIVQKPNKDLYGNEELFLLVRCKNLGCYAAAGDIECTLQNWNGSIPFAIGAMDPSQKKYNDSATYIGDVIQNKDEKLPAIKYDWTCLYTM